MYIHIYMYIYTYTSSWCCVCVLINLKTTRLLTLFMIPKYTFANQVRPCLSKNMKPQAASLTPRHPLMLRI